MDLCSLDLYIYCICWIIWVCWTCICWIMCIYWTCMCWSICICWTCICCVPFFTARVRGADHFRLQLDCKTWTNNRVYLILLHPLKVLSSLFYAQFRSSQPRLKCSLVPRWGQCHTNYGFWQVLDEWNCLPCQTLLSASTEVRNSMETSLDCRVCSWKFGHFAHVGRTQWPWLCEAWRHYEKVFCFFSGTNGWARLADRLHYLIKNLLYIIRTWQQV